MNTTDNKHQQALFGDSVETRNMKTTCQVMKTNLEVFKVLEGFTVRVKGRGLEMTESVAETAQKPSYWN